MTQNPWELGGPIHPQAFGAIFRDTRLALGRSLEDVEHQTRILVRHLAALEAGDFDSLPPGIYARGFVHNYASYLRLNPQEMVRLYNEARGEVDTYYRVQPVARPVNTSGPIAPNFVVIVFVVGMLAVVTAWGYTLLVQPPKTSLVTVEATQPNPTPTTIAGRTIAPAANGGSIPLGSAIIATPTSLPTATTPATTTVTVQLKATGKSFMTITVDGQPFKANYLMNPGETLDVPPGKSVTIKSGAPSNVTYSINGLDQGKLPGTAYTNAAGYTITPATLSTPSSSPGTTGSAQPRG